MLAGTLGAARTHNEGASDVFTPVPLDQQRVSGILAERMRANVEGYLEKADPQELLKNPLSAGLFLLAASDSYEYNEDPNLRKSMDRVASAIVKQPPADLSSLAQSSLIAGLLSYSEETGRDDALAAARKIADTHLSSAAPSMLGPLALLFQATGDDRYMNVARSLSAKPAPDNVQERFIFGSGLVAYYRESSDAAALRKSVELWHAVHPDIAGAPDSSGDTCASAAWFVWTVNLLRATGHIEYSEAANVTLYNQLLAAQSIQSGAVLARVTLSGDKSPASATDRCAAAEGWALGLVPATLWGRIDNAIAIMNYAPGRASFRLHRRTTIQIYSESEYPAKGDILLHIEPTHQTHFHILLRVPPGARSFVAEGAGNRLAGTPGQFLDIAADWKKGDTIHITMDLPAQRISDPQHPGWSALKMGPQILAVTEPNQREFHGLAWTADSVTALRSTPDQLYETTGIEDGKPVKLVLAPFNSASGGNYQVWLPYRQ